MTAGASPTSTYRVQLHAGFTFDDLAAQADYLAALGVTHVYLSPILQAAPGSTHGYDVVDHSRLSDDLGGEEGFERLQQALRAAGLRAVADVVPNHMAVPTPARLNSQWYDVLRNGRDSRFGNWFDIDWDDPVGGRQIVVPVLGAHLAQCVADGEITTATSDAGEPVLRYYDHEFPLRPGTEHLPLPELLARQHYRLAFWRTGNEELNYRRFFDVTTLAGVRVELPDVFDASHARMLELLRTGALTGLRIDHPDGLADPGGYVQRLAEATGGAWVVVEKILEGEEQLPADWPCAGTTGYDAIARIDGLFEDRDGVEPLTRLYLDLTEEHTTFEATVEEAKRQAVLNLLWAEVRRLVEALARICAADPLRRDNSRRALRESLIELLVAFPVYRAYVRLGEEPPAQSVALVDEAVARARTRLPEHRHATLDLLREAVLGRLGRGPDLDDVVVRFQQTCGPAMAKGVEDTAFYRWMRLAGANEVGGDPSHVGTSPRRLSEWCAEQQRERPASMTTLSTHDTKRSEDVRARLAVLTEIPGEWAQALHGWRELTAAYTPRILDGNTEYLLWQTLVGAWPIDGDRLTEYLGKASREAKRRTSWTEPNAAYDEALSAFARAVLADTSVTDSVAEFVARIEPHARANVLGQKLLQLMVPGVPDVYQGSEFVTLALVDPDNRRPVDYAARRALLADLDAGKPADSLDAEKLRVVSAALRLRRDQREWFLGEDSSWEPVAVSSNFAYAFCRSGAVVPVVTRLSARLAAAGGWDDATVTLPDGSWTNQLTGVVVEGGPTPLAGLLADLPVALLVRR